LLETKRSLVRCVPFNHNQLLQALSNDLIGISQRDINYYEFLADMKDELETTIHEFFEDRVRNQFASDNYVFDVYILQNRQTVKLVDFNPFCPTTDGLLYDWAELYSCK
jgi:hypothetical protein